MRKASILNKLNHKPQAHARVCKENKKEKELEVKNDCPLKTFAVKGSTLESCRSTVLLPIELNFTTSQHKGISAILIK